VQKLRLWTVRNWDAVGGDHRNAAEAAVGVDIPSLHQESNEMAEPAYGSFENDQKLQEDSAIPAAMA